MEGLGARIKRAAEQVGGLDHLVGNLSGVSRRTLSDWANDKTEPRASALLEIASCTGVSAAWLLTGDGDMFALSPSLTSAADFPNVAAVALPSPGNARSAQRLGRATRLDPEDIQRLERAVTIVEEGLEAAGRVARPEVKAGMISAAFEMLEEPSETTVGRILRLVKG